MSMVRLCKPSAWPRRRSARDFLSLHTPAPGAPGADRTDGLSLDQSLLHTRERHPHRLPISGKLGANDPVALISSVVSASGRALQTMGPGAPSIVMS